MACAGGSCAASAVGAASGSGWGTALGAILGGAGSLASGLFSSGGSSSAQMLRSLENYYKPTKLGFSWAELENAMALSQYKKQLAASSAADLNLSKQMNEQLPSAQVAGLKAAGLNPILAVLGSGFSPIQSSASASGGSGGARLPSGFTSGVRRVNSAGSAFDFARILGGAIDAEVDNRHADTANKSADTQNKQALTGNIHAQTDLIDAQADKTRAEAEGIRDRIEHGSGGWSDLGREIRSGFGGLLESVFNSIGLGSPDAVQPDSTSQNTGNSAKQPSMTIEVNAPKSYNPERRHRSRPLPSINEYNTKGE